MITWDTMELYICIATNHKDSSKKQCQLSIYTTNCWSFDCKFNKPQMINITKEKWLFPVKFLLLSRSLLTPNNDSLVRSILSCLEPWKHDEMRGRRCIMVKTSWIIKGEVSIRLCSHFYQTLFKCRSKSELVTCFM